MAAAWPALSCAPAVAAAARLRVLMLSDLHSAYRRMPALLELMRGVVRRDGSPSLILLNGDLFEHGNVVAQRTAGALDWAFLQALTKLAPVVMNLGNHDADLVDDQAKTVARARAAGITVLSNIVDARSGRPMAAPQADLNLGGPIHLVGLATNALDTYPAAIRPSLDIPAPDAWARANLPMTPPRDGGVLIIMSHAGLAADKLILPFVPDGALVLGGHDHLVLEADRGRTRYVHTGAWGGLLSVATIERGAPPRIKVEQIAVDVAKPVDRAMAAMVAPTLSRVLTPAETGVIARFPTSLSLGDTGRKVAALMARAADCDVGFIGHTTLGMGIPAGDLTQYDYDAVVRFDGTLMRAEASAAVLADILQHANQDRDLPLDRRTGDFAYAAPAPALPRDRYSIVTTDWCAKHQATYFAREDLSFTEIPGLKVKSVIRDGLRSRPT